MPPMLDRLGIAARVRGLIAGQDGGMVDATAQRLGVSEAALRLSIDDLSPHPTLDVLAAVVRAYGVDPCWLVNGEYHSATHRAALQAGKNVTESNILRLATPRESDGGESAPTTFLRQEA